MPNVARRLTLMARERPDAVAVVEPAGRGAARRRRYRQVTFRQLDDDSDRIARGLLAMGVRPGTRLALLVPAGIDFISLVFGLFKAGAVAILIDPGMGRRSLIGCLAEAEPEGFVAVPLAQAVRCLLRRRFRPAGWNVTVGRRWFWGGPTLRHLRARGGEGKKGRGGDSAADRNCVVSPSPSLPLSVSPSDPAAIIFTTGRTGPPTGVLFTHGNFDAQVDQIRDCYGIQPGEIDLPCFPLFGLFNCAMGVTAVIPDMDPSRPARADPARLLAAAQSWNATQAFGSPAVWDRVGRYCQAGGLKMPTVRRVLSAGAPIPAEVLRLMRQCIHAEGDVHTPYGATEALPVATISATEVLAAGGTAQATRRGAGVCVGRRFSGIQWKVIRVVDGPIGSLQAIEELPAGQIGELIVRGPVVTRRYVTRLESNALAKIADGGDVWHRMGDCGYLDPQERFWFCGRVAHRVLSAAGPMYPVRCEAIFNQHPDVRRTALVGIGPPGKQRPVLIVEPRDPTVLGNHRRREALIDELRRLGEANPLTAQIADFRLHRGFPVDIRHNAKIFREKLAAWAAAKE
jgi:acyl-CoA synthetase (AMP-forming)/AMP-acid ligase II